MKYLYSRSEQGEDDLFLKSLKPMLSRVPEGRKFECKMAVMNLIHSFENPVGLCETVATTASVVPGNQAVTDFWFSSPPSSSTARYGFSSFAAPPQPAATLTPGNSKSWPPIQSHPPSDQASLSAAVGEASHVLFCPIDQTDVSF